MAASVAEGTDIDVALSRADAQPDGGGCRDDHMPRSPSTVDSDIVPA